MALALKNILLLRERALSSATQKPQDIPESIRFVTTTGRQPTTDSCSSAHLFFKDLYSAPCGFSASSGFSAGILFLVQCFFSWCVIDMFSASDCQVCQFESASSLCCVFVLVVVVCTSRQATINFWREKNKYSKCIRSRGAAFGSCWDPLKAHLWV